MTYPAKNKNRNQKMIIPAMIFIFTILFGLLELFLFYLNRNTIVPAGWASAGGTRQDIISLVDTILSAIIFPGLASTFGLLILRRGVVPVIAWLFLFIGLLSAFTGFLSELAIYGIFSQPITWTLAYYLAWVVNFAWIFFFAGALLLLAIFPTGRFLTQRWKKITLPLLLLFTISNLLRSMVEDPLASAFSIDNTFVSNDYSAFINLMYAIGNPALVITILVIFGSVLKRFRISQGREREQMKWLLAGVLLLLISVVVGAILSFGLDLVIGDILINSALIWPVFGIGVALVRYKLYDIDIIIRRTLQYVLVTGLLLLIYFGSVVLLQGLFTATTGQESALSIVVSTLIIAALFNPLRQRIQTIIDRRFYRKKYDAQRVLARFAVAARDETDIDVLSEELQEVVQETIQPEDLSLWIRPLQNE